MSQGPSIQGQIVINTQSVDKAITSVRKLQTNVQKSFGLGGQAAAKFAKTLDDQTKSYDRVANSNRKYQNVIAKAANQVANYEAAVRKSNVADGKKAALIKTASAELKGFEKAVRAGATGGQKLANVSTQLNVSLGQLKRDLTSASAAEREKIKSTKELEQAQIRTDKAVSQASIQYNKAAQAVRDSGMAEDDKLATLNELRVSHKKLTKTLTDSSTTTRQASTAQNQFRESLAQVNAVSNNSRMRQRATETKKYAKEMKNLSTSVVVALGPLSGIASRITALTTLFNRNAASIAVVLASVTGLSVLFSQSAKSAEEAEKQMFRINSQLDILGDSAQITGDEINSMAHRIAAATLLSAKQVRDATGALIEFGGIGRSQFADVTKVAQGMSVVFGGNLQGNIRKLGRAIEDPVDGLQRLERNGIILDEATKELITSLSAQGRTFEATNELLKETMSLQKAAEGEAKGLAGAYDTVSGNLDILYESLFITSGASKAMADSILEVASSISEFSNSAEAAALGEVFETIAGIAGTAFKFLIDNVQILGLALAGIAGSVVPKALAALVALATTGVRGLSTSLQVAVARMGIYESATAAAALKTRAFNSALLANPIVAVATGVATLVSALWSYNSAIDAIRTNNSSLNELLIGQVEDQIKLREDLTKADAEGYRSELQLIKASMSQSADKYKQAEDREKALRKTIADRYKSELEFGFDLAEANTYLQQLNSVESLIELSKSLKGEQKAQVEQLILSMQASDRYKESVEETERALKELGKTIKNATASQEVNSDLGRQLDSVKELSKEYLKEEQAIEKLEEALERVKNTQKGLENSRFLGDVEDYNKANAAIAKTRQIITAIKAELRELSEVEVSKEAQKLTETMADAYKEAKLAMAVVGKSDAEVAVIKLNAEVEELGRNYRDMFAEISAGERADFGEMLGVGADASIDKIAAAYTRFIQVQKEATLEAGNIQAASQMLNEHQQSQMTSMQSLTEQYQKLNEAASLSGRTEDMPKISEWYAEEQAKIEQQAQNVASSPFTNLQTLQDEFAQRQELLSTLYADDEAKYQEHLDTMKAQADKNKAFMSFAQGAEQAGAAVGEAMKAMEAAGKEGTASYKAMAIGQATINAALAISQVLADETLPTYGKIAMAGLIGATAGAQIAQITSTNYATGGYVSGPGSATSDSISANLSNGEFVVQAAAVRAIGKRNLEMMNAGQLPEFSSGGPVGMSPRPMAMSGGTSGAINFTVIDNSNGDKQYRTEEGFDQNGNREMKLIIDNAVKQGISSGQYDREMGSSYGVKRKGRRV